MGGQGHCVCKQRPIYPLSTAQQASSTAIHYVQAELSLTTVPSPCHSPAPALQAACSSSKGGRARELISSRGGRQSLAVCNHPAFTPPFHGASTHTLLPFINSSGRSVSRLSLAHAMASATVSCGQSKVGGGGESGRAVQPPPLAASLA